MSVRYRRSECRWRGLQTARRLSKEVRARLFCVLHVFSSCVPRCHPPHACMTARMVFSSRISVSRQEPPHPRVVGWGIATAVAVHHPHDPLRSRRVESAAARERRARAGTAEKRKGTNNPGSALLALVTLDTWPTIVGQPCADPIAGRLGWFWLSWESVHERVL